MKLIDKDKVVAEIERLKSVFVNERDIFERGYHHSLNLFISFLDTLEVKEVDLEKNNVIGTLEREVKIDAGGYPCIDCYIEFYDYDKDIPLAQEGDKVKIIVVKGE